MTRAARTAVILFLGVIAAAMPTAVWSEAPAINHDGVGCIVVDKFPRLEARFLPAENVSRGRLRFRPSGGAHWYSVPMKQEAEAFVGVLPKPTPKLKSLDYYVEVTATDFATGRTREYTPEVVSGLGACQADKITAGSLGSASIVLEVPPGAPAVPPGFSSLGIVSAAAAAAGAAAAGVATTSAGAAGGLSTAAVVGGAVGAVAVAAAVVGAGGEDTPASPPSPPPPACQPGPLTAALVSPSTSLQCGQPFRTGIAVTNQTCADVTTQSIQLSYNSLGPCTVGVTLFTLPATKTVPAGQTALLEYVSNPYCCFPGPCVTAFQCSYESTFTVQTSGGAVAVGTAPIRVSYDPSCAVCP
jgi:hypothetical protein